MYGFANSVPTLTGEISREPNINCDVYSALPPIHAHICVSLIIATFAMLTALYVSIIILKHHHQKSVATYGEALHNYLPSRIYE